MPKWGAEAVPGWTLDTEGRVWYKNQAPPENATAVAENLWA